MRPTREPHSKIGSIRARLLAPAREVTLQELAARWFMSTIEARVEAYGKLVGDHGLPGRIRGAFGAALAAGASPESLSGSPCPFDPQCAFEALFRKQGRMSSGLDFPSPWVIGVRPVRADLLVTLTVFGFATDWIAAGSEAFTRALLELVDWHGQTGLYLPSPRVTTRVLRSATGVVPSPAARRAELEFLSPLVLANADPRERPSSLLTGLGARISGLARWHDVSVDRLTDWKTLKARAAALDYSFEDIELCKWARGSTRQDRHIPMSGMLCRLGIEGDLGILTILLTLGETSFMGGDTAFGCGRYRVVYA